MPFETHIPASSPNDGEAKPSSPHKEQREKPRITGKIRKARTNYLRAENRAARKKVKSDIEYKYSRIGASLGYVPYLEALLKEVEDKDEWFGDSAKETRLEKRILRSAAAQVRANLEKLRQTLESTEAGGREYAHLRTLYVNRSSRFTELLASVDEERENVELRDMKLAVKQAQETIRHMTTEEAIDWAERTMSSIDSNDWQSRGIKETYANLTQAIKQSLQVKLAKEKQQSMRDPKLARAYIRHSMELAKLFTDRGTPIDSNLTDIDFAADMAKEALGFQELAMRYVEKTMKKESLLKRYVESKRDVVLQKIGALPSETQKNSQVQGMVQTLSTSPQTIQGLSEQYAIVRNLEVMFEGGGTVNLQQELNEKLSRHLEMAMEQFETFLDGNITGAATLREINVAIGSPGLSKEQVKAWKLLADIQGYGYDIGDKTWSYVGAGAKIAAMIAAGIAVGVATGGLGIVGAALAGGAAMTATNAVINQEGFDNLDDALDVYGKDFAVNAATMGAARYLAAGRAGYQLGRAGLLKEAGGMKTLFKVASQKGGLKLINSFDDASHIGTRLAGATLEGSADTLIGASLDTTVLGGSFLENLENNAMFFGLGYAEFAGPALRRLRNLPTEDLHGVAQLVNRVSVERTKLQEKLHDTGIDPKVLLETANPSTMLQNIDGTLRGEIQQSLEQLQQAKIEFQSTLQNLQQRPVTDETQMRTLLRTHDIDDKTRIQYAENILDKFLTEKQRTSFLEAHNKPGIIDNLTPDQKTAKGKELKRNGFTRAEVQKLMDVGLVGSISQWKVGDVVELTEALGTFAPGKYTLRKTTEGLYVLHDSLRKKVKVVQLSELPVKKKVMPSGLPQAPPPHISHIRPGNVDDLAVAVKKERRIEAKRQWPTPDPESIQWKPKERVWLTKAQLSGGEKADAGAYRIGRKENKWYLYSELGGEGYEVTPEIRKELAPVHNLPEEYVATLSPGVGWKLRLDFDAQSAEAVKAVGTVLDDLVDKGLLSSKGGEPYKIGKGGGVASGQPGKEVTVYVGDGKTARLIAGYLDEHPALQPYLRKGTKRTIDDSDMPFNKSVSGRFDPKRDGVFLRYGSKGVPYPKKFAIHPQLKSLDQKEKILKGHEIAKEYFGDYYLGAFPEDNTQ